MSENKLQILHVEDNLETCQLVKRLLTRSNSLVKCTTAMTLSKAIEFLENSHFDSILLDLSLPDSEGLDTINRVIETGVQIPIIVLTGTDDPDITLSVEERPIGGLGIHLVRNIMDEVDYYRHTGKNVVTLVKYLNEAG